jgi:signal transduction histidine kinase
LLRILNDILEFSKIESGQIELKPLPMEPCAIAQEACQLLQATAENKGLSLLLQCEPGVPEVMLGDGDRLRQVVTNLISNGLKFTDQGQVVVRLLSVETAAGTRLRIEVIDSGIGIPESAQAKLFQPFSQADSSITRRFGGMGMGLAICKKLVEVMGGELGVSSVPGQGSTFWLEMPVQTE